jgi:hypothetical protein
LAQLDDPGANGVPHFVQNFATSQLAQLDDPGSNGVPHFVQKAAGRVFGPQWWIARALTACSFPHHWQY